MALNRYRQDYELSETFDEKGRVRTSASYIGKAYVFSGGSGLVKRKSRRLCAFTAGAWICFIGAMIPASAAMHALYIALPFVFTAIPLWLMTEICVKLLRIKEPMERREAELFTNRYPPACGAVFLLPFFALTGEIVRILAGGSKVPGDIVFSVAAALLCADGAVCFRMRKFFSVRER